MVRILGLNMMNGLMIRHHLLIVNNGQTDSTVINVRMGVLDGRFGRGDSRMAIETEVRGG